MSVPYSILLILSALVMVCEVEAFGITHRPSTVREQSTVLSMGLLDSISSFLQQREGDFIKLEETETFGPGPVLLLYKVPYGIDDNEIYDILEDGAPKASKKGVMLQRIPNENDPMMEKSVEEALAQIVDGTVQTRKADAAVSDSGCPVLFFSGFENSEMMGAYNILGREIYMETGGAASPACAKCVPNAMKKPISQVLEEISSDHLSATGTEEEPKDTMYD